MLTVTNRLALEALLPQNHDEAGVIADIRPVNEV